MSDKKATAVALFNLKKVVFFSSEIWKIKLINKYINIEKIHADFAIFGPSQAKKPSQSQQSLTRKNRFEIKIVQFYSFRKFVKATKQEEKMGDKGQIHYVNGKPVADGTMVQIPVR